MLHEMLLGLKRFWSLRWIIKGPILAFLAFVVLVIIAGVVDGGQEEGKEPEAAAVVQTETAPTPEPTRTAEPSPTLNVTSTPTAVAAPTTAPTWTPLPSTPAAAAKPTSVDSAQQVGDARVTCNGYRKDSGGQYFGPAEGYKWVVVDLTVENTGDDEYAMSTLLQMQMRDADGRTYNVAFGPDLRGTLDVIIPVADKVRGEVGFEVPTNAVGLKFIFKQAFGSEQATCRLQD
jgi:hypothetical protein